MTLNLQTELFRPTAWRALTVLIVVIASFYFQPDTANPYRFDTQIISSGAGQVRVTFSHSTEYSIIKTFAGGEQPERIRVAVPYGNCSSIRMDFETTGDVKLQNGRLVTKRNSLIRSLPPSDFLATSGAAKHRQDGSQFCFTPAPDDYRTVVAIHVEPSINLIPQRRIAEVLRAFVVIGGLLILASMLRTYWSKARQLKNGASFCTKGCALPVSRTLLMVMTCSLAFAVLIFRKTDALTKPQLWAEDGPIFFLGAFQGWKSVVEPYAGYLHAFPRLIAAAAAQFDACVIPALYNWSAMALTLAVGARFFSERFAFTYKPLFALAIVLVPHTGEVFLNVTNVGWITSLFLIQTAVMKDPRTPGERTTDIVLLLLAGLTGPFIVLFLPLLAWRFWRRRTSESLIILIFALVTACAQGWFLTQRESQHAETGINVLRAADICYRRTFSWIFIGPNATAQLGSSLALIAGTATLIFWGAASLRQSKHREVKIMLWYSIAVVIGSTVLKVRPDVWPSTNLEDADRYFYLPKIFMIWLLILELSDGRLAARISGSLLAISLTANFTTLLAKPFDDYHWARYCEPIRRGEKIDIPINPSGWFIYFPGNAPQSK